MKKVILLLVLLTAAHCSLHAQVWLPVCEGVRLKKNSTDNPSVLSMAYNSITDELFVAGNFDSLCHRFYNGTMKYNGHSWDTLNTVYYAGGHSADVTVMKFDTVILGGTDDGLISKYFGLNSGELLGEANGAIYALEYYNGDLYAAGTFSKISWWDSLKRKKTVSASNIARWDGQQWYALDGGLVYPGNDSYVFALKVWNNQLYAGGSFNNSYGHCIARWNGTAWLPPPPGFNNASWSGYGSGVKALEVYNGQLFAGGFFDHAGDSTIYNIASWDSTKKEWQNVGGGVCCPVNVLNEIDGRLWAAGYTSPVYWDGIKWHSVGFTTSGIVHTLEGYHGDIFVGGSSFAYADSLRTVFSPCLARLDMDSIAASVTAVSGKPETLTLYPNPAANHLTVTAGEGEGTWTIQDLLGCTVLLHTTPIHSTQTQIDISRLPPGLYVLKVKTQSGSRVTKFVKQ